MSYQTNEPALIVFDGNMTHVTPVHDAGGQID